MVLIMYYEEAAHSNAHFRTFCVEKEDIGLAFGKGGWIRKDKDERYDYRFDAKLAVSCSSAALMVCCNNFTWPSVTL